MGIITKDWIDSHELTIKSKLEPLIDALIVKTLISAPTESTLTYTIGLTSHNYKIGDEIRVADNDAESGYVYYKLYDIEIDGNTQTAVWQELGTVSGGESIVSDGTATIRVTLLTIVNSIQTSGIDLYNTTVTVLNITDSSEPIVKTWTGSDLIFNNLTPLKQYTISVGSVTNYNQPSSYTTLALDTSAYISRTFQYEADGYTINILSNLGVEDTAISSGKLIYNNTEFVNGDILLVPKNTVLDTSTDFSATAIEFYSYAVTIDGTSLNLTYSTEVVTMVIDKDEDEGDITNKKVVIKNSSNLTLGTLYNGDILKIPFGVTYTGTADSAPSGYTKPANLTITAGQAARTLTFTYECDYVDLGLPSGTKWAKKNLGASSPTEEGKYYQWSIPTARVGGSYDFQKSTYITSSHAYGYNGDIHPGDTNQPSGLSAGWGLPTEEDFEELKANTTVSLINAGGGVYYWDVISTINNKKIRFLADTSCYSGTSKLNYSSHTSFFWLANMPTTGTDPDICARALYITSGSSGPAIYSLDMSKWYGLLVRPVFRKTQAITIHLNSVDGVSVNNKKIRIEDRLGSIKDYTTDSNGDFQVPINNLQLGELSIGSNYVYVKTRKINNILGITNYTINVSTLAAGVYAWYENGTLKSVSEADSSANGVAIIKSAGNAFVFKRYDISSKFGGYGKTFSSGTAYTTTPTTSATAFNGYNATIGFYSNVKFYTDSSYSITGSPLIRTIRRQNPKYKWYLPTAGEINYIAANCSAVNEMLSIINQKVTIDYGSTSYKYAAMATINTNGNTNYTYTLYGTGYTENPFHVASYSTNSPYNSVNSCYIFMTYY